MNNRGIITVFQFTQRAIENCSAGCRPPSYGLIVLDSEI